MGRKLNKIAPLLLILAACAPSKEDKPETTLSKSLEAHGGWETFSKVDSLSYNKTTILYDSAGNIESKLTQTHKYKFGNQLSGSISWLSDSTEHKILFKGQEASKYINGDATPDPSAINLVNSSQFVLLQPFKLKDAGTTLKIEEKKWLQNDSIYKTLKPIYGGESTDQWWFYVNSDDHLISANLVRHNDRYSFIENLEFIEDQPLVLHHHRKSYFTDSLLNDRLLRAEYWYENYSILLSE